MLFVASAFASKSTYGGNGQVTSSKKIKMAAAGIKPAPAGRPILMM